MATTKTPTRKTPAKAPAAKAPAKRQAARGKAPAKAAVSRARFGPTECHAPGCDGQRYLKGSLLCQDHQAQWAKGTFRLSQRGWDRLNASKAPATTGRGKRAARAAKGAPVATSDEDLEAVLAQSASAFATPALAKAAAVKRAARRAGKA
jgi:hypothetical protein